MKTVRNSILFLLSIFLFSNLSAMSSFRKKVQNRSMRSLNSGPDRYSDSSDLSLMSRASMISYYRFGGNNHLDLEFSRLTGNTLFFELNQLNNRLKSSMSSLSKLRFYKSHFGLREVKLLVNILVNNMGCTLLFSNCSIDDIAAENLYSILKVESLNLDMDLDGMNSDDEDEVNDFINDFVEDLNSGCEIEFVV